MTRRRLILLAANSLIVCCHSFHPTPRLYRHQSLTYSRFQSHFRSMSTSSSASVGLKDIGGDEEGARISSSDDATASKRTKANQAQWVADLNRSMARNSKDAHSRYMQLATIAMDEDGQVRPTCRTVVFRGFLPGTEMLKMITDSRSEKFSHLAQNDAAEICWYFVKTREQYRITGYIKVISSTEFDKALLGARKHQWSSLSDNARVQFIWPDPGLPLPEGGYEDPEAVFSPPAPTSSSQPPDSFCLLLFIPEKIDHLELKANPQRRTVHRLLKPSADADYNVGVKVWEGEGGTKSQWEALSVNP